MRLLSLLTLAALTFSCRSNDLPFENGDLFTGVGVDGFGGELQ